MQRRDALKLLPTAALPAMLAGCTGELTTGTTSTATDTTDTTAGSTSTDGATTGTDEDPDGDPDATVLSVEQVNVGQYVLRMNDLGRSPGAQPTDVADLSSRERSVVEAATADGYQTDEVPSWLAQFAADTRHVVDGDRYYHLQYDLPVYEVTAERVDESDVGNVASQEAYREAVTHDGVVFSGLIRIALRDGFRTTYVWPALDEFLSEYDAVEYRNEGVVAMSVSTEDPGAPYTVTATGIPPTELVDRPVWDVSEAPSEVRQVVREAGQTSGVYSLDDPPEGLLDALDSHEYAYLDGRFYTTYVENRDPLPVTLDATAVGGDDAPALDLSLRNDADETVTVQSGAPAPFGVLYLHAADGGRQSLLWRDAYEENTHVHTEGRRVTGVNSIGLLTEVAPGESVDATFELEPGLASGEYVIDNSIGIRLPNDGGGTFDYRVRVRVE